MARAYQKRLLAGRGPPVAALLAAFAVSASRPAAAKESAVAERRGTATGARSGLRRRETSGGESLCADRHKCSPHALDFRLLTVDCVTVNPCLWTLNSRRAGGRSLRQATPSSGFGPDAPHPDTRVQRQDLQPLPPVTDHRSQVAGHRGVTSHRSRVMFLQLSPLECTLAKKCVCKSFGMHSYKIIGLKVLWNEHLQKNTGGGGVPQKWKS